MEDALVRYEKASKNTRDYVLILVLMEDALVPLGVGESVDLSKASLNPCFNGRCTRTSVRRENLTSSGCLNPCFNGRCTRTPNIVYVR